MKRNFCENCGKQLDENGLCSNCGKEGGEISKENKGAFLFLDIVRYVIGSFFIFGNLFNLPRIDGILGILFGISFFPVIYRNLFSKFIKSPNNTVNKVLSICLPIFLLFAWIFLSPVDTELSDSDSDSNSNYSSGGSITESLEEKVLKEIKNNFSDSEVLSNYKFDKETNKYDIEIQYTKNVSGYICASDAEYYVKKIIGNKNINTIQFECPSNGIFKYVKFEKVDTLTSDTIRDNTKYYDENQNKIETNISKLQAKHIQDYKNSCQTFNYKDVLRNPDNFQDKNAYWFGEIVQVITKTSSYSEFRVNVSCTKYEYIGGYNCPDTIYVTYFGSESFIEDDMVKIWGTMDGTKTYTTVMGASVTVPKMTTLYMELQK